jgi:DNA-binding CsgD family transcriptional regulator
MLVISPANSSERITLPADGFGKVISAAGTEAYGEACFNLLEQMLGVDHWALFQYPGNTSISCLATASGMKTAEAQVNIDKFVGRCHNFDPSLTAIRAQYLQEPCLVTMAIGDIKNREYRRCFEATDVQERLSYFTPTVDGLYQLSIYRGPWRRTFSHSERKVFATLDGLILATALQHEARRRTTSVPALPMTLATIQERLAALPEGLSERECEVCARAVAGITIEGTALDLDIRKTSVITYRQRAYQKLGISSLNQLVAILHNVKPGLTAGCGPQFAPGIAARRRALHS